MSSVPGKIKAPTFLQETAKAPVEKPQPKVGKVKADFLNNQQARKVEKTQIDIVSTGKVKTDFLKQANNNNNNEAQSPNRNTQVKKVALPTFLQGGDSDAKGSSSSPADHAKPSPKKISNPFLKAEQEKKEKELAEKESKRRLAEKHLSPREDEEQSQEPEVQEEAQEEVQEESKQEEVQEEEPKAEEEVAQEREPESAQEEIQEEVQEESKQEEEVHEEEQITESQPAEREEEATPEPVVESVPEAEAEAEAEAIPERVEAVAEPVAEEEPVVEAAPETVAEPEPIAEEPVAEPVVESVPEPASEPISQPEAEKSSQVDDLDLLLQKANSELEETRSQLAQSNTDHLNEITSLKEKLSITEETISRFGEQVQELTSAKEGLAQENSTLLSKIANLEAQISEQEQIHQQQLASAAAVAQPAVQQEESGNNDVIEELQRNKAALEQQVADLQAKLNEFIKSNQNITQSFEGQLSSLEKSLQLSQESEQAAIKRVQYLEHQVTELQRASQQKQPQPQVTSQPAPTPDPTPVHIPAAIPEPEQSRKIEQPAASVPASKASSIALQSAPLPPAAFTASGSETRHGVITVIGLDQIKASIKSIFHADAYSGWIIVGYTGAASIALQLSNPTGTVPELVSQLLDDQVQYCLVRIPLTDKFGNKTSRDLLIQWIGPKVSLIVRGKKSSHQKDVMDVVKPFHYDLSATGKRNFTLENLIKISSPNSGSHEISD